MKMEKASNLVEDIFSHAVSLSQANRLKSAIYCLENRIFILNFDNTILLKFTLPEFQKPFNNPVSFHANDYDSNRFFEEDGQIVFVSEMGEVERRKTLKSPGATPEEVEQMFQKYDNLDGHEITFHRSILDALDNNLSHIEIRVVGGEWSLTQRDIFSGATIVLKELKKGLQFQTHKSKGDAGPYGIRTSDFSALFSFNERVTFTVDPDCDQYVTVSGKKYQMEGIVAFCVYDEIGDLLPAEPKEELPKKESCEKKPAREEKQPEKSETTQCPTPTTRRRGVR